MVFYNYEIDFKSANYVSFVAQNTKNYLFLDIYREFLL